MKPINNLLNKVFKRLIVIERTPNPGTRKNDTAAYWKCLCSCGNTAIIRGYSLTTDKTQSCGCLKLEALFHVVNIVILLKAIYHYLTFMLGLSDYLLIILKTN